MSTVQDTYTPDALASAVVACLGLPAGSHVCEPHVGGGAFVRALREHVPHVKVYAYDIDPKAEGLALADWGLAIDLDLVKPLRRPWTIAVGNPDFGGPSVAKDWDRPDYRGRRPGEPAYKGAHHIARMLPGLEVAAFVLPWSWYATGMVRKVLFDPHPPAEVIPCGRVWSFLREVAVYVWRADHDGPTVLSPPLQWRQKASVQLPAGSAVQSPCRVTS